MSNRTPVEIDAEIPPRAMQDLAGVIRDLGYEPTFGAASSDGRGDDPGRATVWLKVAGPIEPEAASVLLQAVSDWIHRRPAQKGRFRRRRPRPITVTIFGQNGEQVASAVVERG
jgi:hypothetical protein